MGEYINIYGLLFAKTADGKLAFTGQIWDEELQKFQSDINKSTPQLGEDGKLPADLLPESLQNATSTEVLSRFLKRVRPTRFTSLSVRAATRLSMTPRCGLTARGLRSAVAAEVRSQGPFVTTKRRAWKTLRKPRTRENIGAASQKDVDDINQILFTQYTALSMSRTPASFEKGVETEVTLNWSTKFNNQEIEPDSLEVKKGNEVLTSDKTLKTIKDSVTNTQAYSMTAVIKGITKTASVTVNAYYPMYFGASAKNALESADILAMTKQPIKSSPAGNATVEVGANEYLWLCVPSTMSINSVKSGGFDVPMAAPATVAVDGKGDYKCYRSASPFAEGTFTGVIA